MTVSDGHGGQGFGGGYSQAPTDPVVSISETDTDTNQTVLCGSDANFDIHVHWGATKPNSQMTVFYSTMDPSGGATAYTSTYGTQQVTFYAWNFNQNVSGDWVADDTCYVDTTPGIYDGSTSTVMVQLSNPYQCQLAVGAAEATATVVHLGIKMTSPATKVVSGTDANGNPLVTTVVVGQQMVLQLTNLPAGLNVTGVQWTIPGTSGNAPFAIENYTQALAGGAVTTFGHRTRSCRKPACSSIGSLAATRRRRVISTSGLSITTRPPISSLLCLGPISRLPRPATSRTTIRRAPSVLVPTESTGTTRSTSARAAPVISDSWTASATADAAEGGSIQVVQLVDSTEWFTPRGAFPRTTVVGTFGNYVLDAYPAPGAYEIQQPPRDLTTGQMEPGTGVLPVGANQTATLTSIDNPSMSLAGNTALGGTARYVTYLMYKPDTPNSIWVTLQTITWGWGGSATLGPNGWSLNPGSYPGNPYIRMVGMTSSTLPQWIKDLA